MQRRFRISDFGYRAGADGGRLIFLQIRNPKSEIRNIFNIFLLLIGSWLLVSLPLRAEVIDKMVAVVNNRVILLSDVRQERELQAILREKTMPDEAVLQNLIEQVLVEDQIAQFPGVEVTESEIEPELNAVKDRHDLPAQTIRDGIERRIRRAKYFDLRFRQFITATDEEVRQYYETVFVPAARARGLEMVPPLEEVAAPVRANVIDEKMNHEVEIWLEAIRGRSDIEVFQ